LRKLEKRCEQDRLLSGQLTAVREKGLHDARKLCDTLQKSVEALSDCLDQAVPQMAVEEDDADAVRGAGVEVWTKEAGGTEDLGPFDDEETRAFYFDIPDLLTIIPPALLGIADEDIDKRREANKQKYGRFITAGSDADAEMSPSTETSEAQFDALERGEMPGVDEEGGGGGGHAETGKAALHIFLFLCTNIIARANKNF
jgi:regulator of nonsense transcripts 2